MNDGDELREEEPRIFAYRKLITLAVIIIQNRVMKKRVHTYKAAERFKIVIIDRDGYWICKKSPSSQRVW